MSNLKSTCGKWVLGVADIIFKDNRVQILKKTEEAIEATLIECAAELVSQTARNSRHKTGQLKGSWQYHVEKTAEGYEAVIGSPLENAIWEEFGTGEQAINGNGRKGWHGKSASRAFFKAYTKKKKQIEARLAEKLKGL